MNEIIKIFFYGFASSAISIAITIICTIFFRKNRRTTDNDVGAGIQLAGGTCESAGKTSTELAGTTEQAIRIEQDLAGTNEQLTESITRSKQILQEIKKRHAER